MLTEKTLNTFIVGQTNSTYDANAVDRDIKAYKTKLKQAKKDIEVQIESEKSRWEESCGYSAPDFKISTYQYNTHMKFLVGQRIAFEYALLLLEGY